MKKGFTLIEMIVSIGLFAIVMTISVGTLVGVFDENRKADSLKTAMDNMSQALETMSREMRFGHTYACGQSPVIAASMTPSDCPNNPGSLISFIYQSGQTIGYRLNNNTIERWTEANPNWLPLTAPEIKINSLNFYVIGSASGDALQPKVLININGLAGNPLKPLTETSFSVQTLVSQRSLDY